MSETLYNLINSQSFWVIVAAWIFICIAWTERWKPVLSRIATLLIKPVIFRPDPNPENVPFYPRTFLEDSANGLRDTLKEPFADLISVVSNWYRGLATLIYSKDHPFRTLGYFLLLFCFLFFILTDAIAVANTLVVLGLWAGALPTLLARFDIAVFGGSLLALVIGMMLIFEIRSEKSEFSQWTERDNRTKALGLGVAILVTMLSLIALMNWALFRLVELNKLEPSTTTDLILNFVLFGVVPINGALAASITFLEALRGILGIFIIIGWMLVVVLQVFNYTSTIIGSLAPFIFDIVYRLIYIVVDILQWIITTPIQAIVYPFRMIALIFSASEDVEAKRQKK